MYDPKDMQHDGEFYQPEGVSRYTRQAVLFFVAGIEEIANHEATIETEDDLRTFARFAAEGWELLPTVPLPERPDRGWFE